MKIRRSHIYAAAGAFVGLVVVWWWRRQSSPSSPPAVAGTITSGSQSATIDANVISPGFGLPLLN